MSTPRRMVVVDDDPKVRVLLERAFRQPEFETYTFPTGAAALAGVQEIRPDCVVSDLLMPDMDGEGLLRGLRSTPGLEHVPFVAVSAVRSEARIRAVLAAGANAFLLKPFPLRELLDKVRSLLQPAEAEPAEPEEAAEEENPPTRPLVAAAHTMSTAAVPRRVRFEPAPLVMPVPAAGTATAVAERAPAVIAAATTAPVPAIKAPEPRAAPPTPAAPAADEGVRRVELRPPESALGFGRFTRVEARGRSFVVLTEATAQPKFTVTTVITERGVALRRLETALPHPLAREEDNETVRRQLDLQHDDALERLDHLVLESTQRRVLWSDQNRSVDPVLLAWVMSVVAQLAETETGSDETTRALRRTYERTAVEEDLLRVFHVTPEGRVAVNAEHRGRLPRRAVGAVAAWCLAFAVEALQLDEERALDPIQHATHRHALDLERLGFYGRLRRRMRAG